MILYVSSSTALQWKTVQRLREGARIILSLCLFKPAKFICFLIQIFTASKLLLILNTSEETGRELATCTLYKEKQLLVEALLCIFCTNARVEKKSNSPDMKLRLTLIMRDLWTSILFLVWVETLTGHVYSCVISGRCCNTPGFVSLPLLLVFNISYAISVFFELVHTSAGLCLPGPVLTRRQSGTRQFLCVYSTVVTAVRRARYGEWRYHHTILSWYLSHDTILYCNIIIVIL